jgi:glucose-6-phosphate isomerase
VIRIDESFIGRYVSETHFQQLEGQARLAHHELFNSDTYKEAKGWLSWPVDDHAEMLEKVEQIAKGFRSLSSLVVVVGIGGSYLGAKAAVSMMKSPFVSTMGDGIEVVFAGHQLSAIYMARLQELLDKHEVSLIVVSKSGGTLEPSAAFHILREYLEKRYGNDANDRICAITDPVKGALHDFAKEHGYSMLPIPSDIGGRYSVLTAVGLLPMRLAGIDILQVMEGAKKAHTAYQNDMFSNPAMRYALYRHVLYQKGFSIEALITYEPQVADFALWWQQLFGESQGKDGIGLFPTMLQYTTDLHSMGQYVQDARKIMIETVLDVTFDDAPKSCVVPQSVDKANQHLASRNLADMQKVAIEAVAQVHSEGGVPNIVLRASGSKEELFGELVFFFEVACALGGYMLGIHPFNQPGVEGYKQEIMRRLK